MCRRPARTPEPASSEPRSSGSRAGTRQNSHFHRGPSPVVSGNDPSASQPRDAHHRRVDLSRRVSQAVAPPRLGGDEKRAGSGSVINMRVFVAGGSGVIGRRLVPQLVARGHQVTATTTSAGKLGLLEQLGAEGVVMDGLDAAAVGEAVAVARPDTIVNQMTALSVAHAGKPNLRRADRFFATTNRLRTAGTDHLLAAAEATGVSHVVAQGHASMNGAH